jgi:hypothetical protein
MRALFEERLAFVQTQNVTTQQGMRHRRVCPGAHGFDALLPGIYEDSILPAEICSLLVLDHSQRQTGFSRSSGGGSRK